GFLGMIKKKKEKEETMKIFKDILGLCGAGVSPDSHVSVLSGGERQGLVIGRAIYFNSDIIILDEPCTALAINEANKVLSFIKEIKANNKSAILISHNLSHVYEVADRFIFLNHGKIAGNFQKSELDLESLSKTLISLSSQE
ncbi:MAG: ATP-binding cassette domain-containing protein, partial [Desulfobacteraceae bacterium]|nr:ATP-binding cassette domain-containing protein [Desulfobacteraceae bacterium]